MLVEVTGEESPSNPQGARALGLQGSGQEVMTLLSWRADFMVATKGSSPCGQAPLGHDRHCNVFVATSSVSQH